MSASDGEETSADQLAEDIIQVCREDNTQKLSELIRAVLEILRTNSENSEACRAAKETLRQAVTTEPKVFQVPAVQLHLFRALDFTRDTSVTSPPHARRLLATLLGVALQNVDEWPIEALRIYVADAIGARAFVDAPEAKQFVHNAHTGVRQTEGSDSIRNRFTHVPASAKSEVIMEQLYNKLPQFAPKGTEVQRRASGGQRSRIGASNARKQAVPSVGLMSLLNDAAARGLEEWLTNTSLQARAMKLLRCIAQRCESDVEERMAYATCERVLTSLLRTRLKASQMESVNESVRAIAQSHTQLLIQATKHCIVLGNGKLLSALLLLPEHTLQGIRAHYSEAFTYAEAQSNGSAVLLEHSAATAPKQSSESAAESESAATPLSALNSTAAEGGTKEMPVSGASIDLQRCTHAGMLLGCCLRETLESLEARSNASAMRVVGAHSNLQQQLDNDTGVSSAAVKLVLSCVDFKRVSFFHTCAGLLHTVESTYKYQQQIESGHAKLTGRELSPQMRQAEFLSCAYTISRRAMHTCVVVTQLLHSFNEKPASSHQTNSSGPPASRQLSRSLSGTAASRSVPRARPARAPSAAHGSGRTPPKRQAPPTTTDKSTEPQMKQKQQQQPKSPAASAASFVNAQGSDSCTGMKRTLSRASEASDDTSRVKQQRTRPPAALPRNSSNAPSTPSLSIDFTAVVTQCEKLLLTFCEALYKSACTALATQLNGPSAPYAVAVNPLIAAATLACVCNVMAVPVTVDESRLVAVDTAAICNPQAATQQRTQQTDARGKRVTPAFIALLSSFEVAHRPLPVTVTHPRLYAFRNASHKQLQTWLEETMSTHRFNATVALTGLVQGCLDVSAAHIWSTVANGRLGCDSDTIHTHVTQACMLGHTRQQWQGIELAAQLFIEQPQTFGESVWAAGSASRRTFHLAASQSEAHIWQHTLSAVLCCAAADLWDDLSTALQLYAALCQMKSSCQTEPLRLPLDTPEAHATLKRLRTSGLTYKVRQIKQPPVLEDVVNTGTQMMTMPPWLLQLIGSDSQVLNMMEPSSTVSIFLERVKASDHSPQSIRLCESLAERIREHLGMPMLRWASDSSVASRAALPSTHSTTKALTAAVANFIVAPAFRLQDTQDADAITLIAACSLLFAPVVAALKSPGATERTLKRICSVYCLSSNEKEVVRSCLLLCTCERAHVLYQCLSAFAVLYVITNTPESIQLTDPSEAGSKVYTACETTTKRHINQRRNKSLPVDELLMAPLADIVTMAKRAHGAQNSSFQFAASVCTAVASHSHLYLCLQCLCMCMSSTCLLTVCARSLVQHGLNVAQHLQGMNDSLLYVLTYMLESDRPDDSAQRYSPIAALLTGVLQMTLQHIDTQTAQTTMQQLARVQSLQPSDVSQASAAAPTAHQASLQASPELVSAFTPQPLRTLSAPELKQGVSVVQEPPSARSVADCLGLEAGTAVFSLLQQFVTHSKLQDAKSADTLLRSCVQHYFMQCVKGRISSAEERRVCLVLHQLAAEANTSLHSGLHALNELPTAYTAPTDANSLLRHLNRAAAGWKSLLQQATAPDMHAALCWLLHYLLNYSSGQHQTLSFTAVCAIGFVCASVQAHELMHLWHAHSLRRAAQSLMTSADTAAVNRSIQCAHGLAALLRRWLCTYAAKQRECGAVVAEVAECVRMHSVSTSQLTHASGCTMQLVIALARVLCVDVPSLPTALAELAAKDGEEEHCPLSQLLYVIEPRLFTLTDGSSAVRTTCTVPQSVWTPISLRWRPAVDAMYTSDEAAAVSLYYLLAHPLHSTDAIQNIVATIPHVLDVCAMPRNARSVYAHWAMPVTSLLRQHMPTDDRSRDEPAHVLSHTSPAVHILLRFCECEWHLLYERCVSAALALPTSQQWEPLLYKCADLLELIAKARRMPEMRKLVCMCALLICRSMEHMRPCVRSTFQRNGFNTVVARLTRQYKEVHVLQALRIAVAETQSTTDSPIALNQLTQAHSSHAQVIQTTQAHLLRLVSEPTDHCPNGDQSANEFSEHQLTAVLNHLTQTETSSNEEERVPVNDIVQLYHIVERKEEQLPLAAAGSYTHIRSAITRIRPMTTGADDTSEALALHAHNQLDASREVCVWQSSPLHSEKHISSPQQQQSALASPPAPHHMDLARTALLQLLQSAEDDIAVLVQCEESLISALRSPMCLSFSPELSRLICHAVYRLLCVFPCRTRALAIHSALQPHFCRTNATAAAADVMCVRAHTNTFDVMQCAVQKCVHIPLTAAVYPLLHLWRIAHSMAFGTQLSS